MSSSDACVVEFHGTLDVKTLGGAGFASRRTMPDLDPSWDLSDYDGIELTIEKGDGRFFFSFPFRIDFSPVGLLFSLWLSLLPPPMVVRYSSSDNFLKHLFSFPMKSLPRRFLYDT